ncbi:MAG: Lrp/AsnC family transcriptional regulator [Nanoarchaeota archaeon]|nr:Lrp/AsnC family transcriptional regulator [Nanoarchaeota archaeon]
MPVTTIYDKLRVHEKKYVDRHTTLLDFSKLGMHSKASIAIACDRDSRTGLQDFLMKSPNVNSLYKTNHLHDFVAEVVFKDIGQLHRFTENIEMKFQVTNLYIFSIIEELKKEGFLTSPDHRLILD